MDGTTRPAGTPGTTNRAAAAGDDAAELIRVIRALAQRTGRDVQARQAAALDIPNSSLSAYLYGRIPSEKTFVKMLNRAGVPTHEHSRHLAVLQRASQISRRASAVEPEADRMTDGPGTSADTADPEDRGDPGDPGDLPIPARQRREVPGRTSRRVGLAVAIIAAASVLVFTAALLWLDRTPGGPSAAPATTPAATDGVKQCDRYSIDAVDLGLRTPDGTDTGEVLKRGTAVTVLHRNGPAGRLYWYVTTDDQRQSGWVLPSTNWWHPICSP